MINFNHYSKPHDNGKGGGGVTINIGGGVNNSDLPQDLTVTSINAEKGDIKRLNGTSLTYNNANFIYMIADEGTVKKLRGEEINYNVAALGEIQSGTINNEGKITTADLESLKAYIKSLQSSDITTENLTVTRQAHFFELIIDKIKSTNGAIIVSQANCSLDYVKAFNSSNHEVALDANNVAYYWAYFEANDQNGKAISNDWRPYDQAMCMSFNDVKVGANYDVQSKYYWRLVKDVSSNEYININTGEKATQGTSTSVNTIHIDTPTIGYTIDENGTPKSYELTEGWQTQSQNASCTWSQTSGGIGAVTKGVFTTTDTIWGIQLKPVLTQVVEGKTVPYDNPLASYIPDKFSFTTTENVRLNIGVYYNDGNSQYFPAPEKGQATNTYEVNLTTTSAIEAVVITNADEVAWHLMHGIKLSNISGEYDSPAQHTSELAYNDLYKNKSSIPSIGDNVVQLGYRYASAGTQDEARASAIIISAYKTPDQGGYDPWGNLVNPITPPSYAQYKNIQTFSLASYRHTYFDANDASFIGNFYAGGSHNPIGQRGPQGDPGPQGPRGSQGDIGEQGIQGLNGRDGQTYTLIDQGSQAYMSSTLDNNGNVVNNFLIDLTYKVDKLVGSTAHFMTVDEAESQCCDPNQPNVATPFWAYAAWNKPGTGNGLKYYKMGKLSSPASADQNYTYHMPDGQQGGSWITDAINTNNNIVVALLRTPLDGPSQANMPNSFAVDNATYLSCVIDSVSLPITMENSASLKIVQGQAGQQAAIKTLVNGQEGLQTNFALMTQTMHGFQTTVEQLQGDIGGVQSQITQTASEINSTVAEVRKGCAWVCVKTIDLTNSSSYNQNTFYPVGIILPQNPNGEPVGYGSDANGSPVRIKVESTFGDSTPTWGQHQNSFSFNCTWTTIGGQWGIYWNANVNALEDCDVMWTQNEKNNDTSTDDYRHIETFEYAYVNGKVAGSIVQNNPTSEEFIYLRGGAKYNIYVSWYIAEQNLKATIGTQGYIKAYPNGWSWSSGISGKGSKTLGTQSASQIVEPIVDDVKYSKITQRIDGIQAYVVNGLESTGIDIGHQKIDLRANKVTFSSSDGTQSGKIYIDPTYGTLHAQNAKIGGTLTANVLYQNVGQIDEVENPTNYYVENDFHSFYLLNTGLTGHTINIYLPETYKYPGMQIQFFRPKSPSGSDYAEFYLKTDANSYTRIYDGVTPGGTSSYHIEINKLTTIISSAGYWYIV